MQEEYTKQLISFLTTAQAHMPFEEAVADFPPDRINDIPPHVDYTPWMLLEHIRLTQKDILEFLTNPTYKEPQWPEDYWTEKRAKADTAMWQKTIDEYKADRQQIVEYLQKGDTDLTAKVKNGNGQSVFREILLVIDHTAYHIGEFAILRQVMGTWPPDHQ